MADPHTQRIVATHYCNCESGIALRSRHHRDRKKGLGREGIPPKYFGLTVQGYRDVANGDEEKQEALKAAVDVCRGSGESLFLYGPNGVGKSGLLTAVYRHLTVERVGFWYAYPDLLADVRDGYGSSEASARILNMQRVDTLLIDDLGDPFRDELSETDNARAIMFDILRHRYDHNKTTLITTNFQSLDAMMQAFDPRIVDRLRHMCRCVFVGGTNLRLL